MIFIIEGGPGLPLDSLGKNLEHGGHYFYGDLTLISPTIISSNH